MDDKRGLKKNVVTVAFREAAIAEYISCKIREVYTSDAIAYSGLC